MEFWEGFIVGIFAGIILCGLTVFLFNLFNPFKKEISNKEMNKVYDKIDKKQKKETERKSSKQKAFELMIEMDPEIQSINKRIAARRKKYEKDTDPYLDELMKKYGL